MKVLLINPPSENLIGTNLPEMLEKARGHSPPLGIMYIASMLEKKGHKVEILDCQVEEFGHKEVEDEIRRRKPDLVGISAMTFTLIDAILIAKTVKRIDPGIKVAVGGSHVNIYPNETIKLEEVDYVVLGEAEFLFTEMVDNIDKPEKLKQTKGLLFKENGKVIYTGPVGLIEDLDSLPFPARHLTPYKKYSSVLSTRNLVTTMISSRGCPYKCLFCDRPISQKGFRARSAKNVVDEMEKCYEMGIDEFLLYDDTFTIDRQRAIDICNEIMARKLDIGWDIRARVNTVDMELLMRLSKAGCERIHYGVESGNQEILNILRKGITLEQVESAFRMTKNAGIEILAYFMIGSPRETRETIMQSINFAKKLNPDFVHFSVTTPFPATDLYDMGLKEGILPNDYWKAFAENPTPDFKPMLWEENLSKEELIELLRLAYKSFYMNPTYILQRIMKIRSPGEFARKAGAGLKVFRL